LLYLVNRNELASPKQINRNEPINERAIQTDVVKIFSEDEWNQAVAELMAQTQVSLMPQLNDLIQLV